ncbi:hypothetical protein PoB_005014100 [Plakobranchus ocellatus]|uniref:Uncharacterized protein n=1 Tax=Plakobranchus ocellatus TaxID=259542 RepID=A0AAV4BJY0_9GAST|nr:hypothetical protein PoB_005014100 [Plakobranchus ocellatus]
MGAKSNKATDSSGLHSIRLDKAQGNWRILAPVSRSSDSWVPIKLVQQTRPGLPFVMPSFNIMVLAYNVAIRRRQAPLFAKD